MATSANSWSMMVLHHVAQGAGMFVERAAAAFHADRFRGRDLHVIDILAIEQRLEDGVAEAKRQQVLHRVLAQIVVDAIDLSGLRCSRMSRSSSRRWQGRGRTASR